MNEIASTSLQGLHQARNEMDKASRRIAAWPATPDSQTTQDSGPATRLTEDTYTPSIRPDLVADVLSVQQARTAAEANLVVLSKQLELEKSTLDLLG